MRKQLVLVALLLFAGCGDNDVGLTFTLHVGADAPAYGDAPFPTDAMREGDHLGRIAGFEKIATRKLELITEHVAALDGFGVRPLVEFFVDGDLDGIDPSALGLIDVDPASPTRGNAIAMEWRYFADRRVIAGSPQSGQVLREGTRYAAFVTTAVHEGVTRHGALDSFARFPRWQSAADALAELDGTVDGEIAAIAVFTTQRASAPLVAARTHMATLPLPELACDNPALIFSGTALDDILGQATRAVEGPRTGLERWGNDNPTGIAHDHVGTIATCTFTIARYRRDDTGTDLPDDETFEVIDGVPQLVAIEPIPVTFILPKAPPPADGYPVIVYGHGLGASRDQLFSFAEPLTAQGYAIAGIDMEGHGSRYDDTDRVSNMANQLSDFTGRISGADGFGDATGPQTQFDFFEGFQNVAAVRDSIRQSALDISRLVQLVRRADLDLSAMGSPKLDARRVVYMAESFGTVVGTLLAAIEPDVDLYVLDVPGGGILDLILPSSPEIAQLAVPVIETIYNPLARLDRWNPLIGLMQAAIDGGDPLTYAPHVLRDRFTIAGAQLGPRSVVALEVLGDQVLANVGTDALARELGLSVLEPNLDVPDGLASVPAPAVGNLAGQTAVLVQYAPATHGANWSAERGTLRFLPGFPFDGEERFPRLPADISIANPIYETFDQVIEILASHRANGVPGVKLTKAPTRDFDGDGVTDDVDAEPYDPAMH